MSEIRKEGMRKEEQEQVHVHVQKKKGKKKTEPCCLRLWSRVAKWVCTKDISKRVEPPGSRV